MKRMACLLMVFCGCLASASLARSSLDRLDYTGLLDRWGHVLDGYGYTGDPLGLRTNLTRNLGLTTNSLGVGYDSIGQLVSWSGKETGGALRQNEQFGFGYDRAHNLNSRTNGALIQTFNTDVVNQLTNITRSGALTVSGVTTVPATNVTVNGQAAQTYGDFTFASQNNTLTNGQNGFTIVARNSYGLGTTNFVSVNLPSSVALQYDLNGNLTNDGTRSFAYDAEDRLVTNWVAGAWKSEFVYDGLGRRRIERDYSWNAGTWQLTNETHCIYDGWLVVQERNSNNVVQVTYTRGLDLSGTLQVRGRHRRFAGANGHERLGLLPFGRRGKCHGAHRRQREHGGALSLRPLWQTHRPMGTDGRRECHAVLLDPPPRQFGHELISFPGIRPSLATLDFKGPDWRMGRDQSVRFRS